MGRDVWAVARVNETQEGPYRALGRDGFEALAGQAAWEMEVAVDEPASLAFRLVKG